MGVVVNAAWRRLGWAAVCVSSCWWSAAAVAQTFDAVSNGAADVFQGQRASAEVRKTARWIAEARDAQAKPFAIVDKRDARVFVFAAGGRLVGSAPALLGMAVGDDSAPGVGQRVLAGIAPRERTTPAGRFDSEPGHNHKGEAIVWVDYAAAIAIHRLRPTDPAERRPQRLASETPEDNRISLGCVVVSPAFYDEVVAPTLGRQRGVVYVLPETRRWESLFGPALSAGL